MSEQNVKQAKSDSEVPNNKKCFIIMPISTPEGYPENHFKQVYDTIIAPAVKKAGYEPHRVDDDRICDSIIDKILRSLVESEMAVCDLSSRNPNVMYELGIRQAYGKKVVLIQDEKSQPIFDVSAINTVFYNSRRTYEDVIASQNEISEAIISTAKEDSISLMSIAKIPSASAEAQSESDDKQIYEVMLSSILNSVRRLEQSQVMQNRRLRDSATRNDCIAARYIDLQNDIYKAINREELDKDELIYCRRKILFFIQDLRRDPNMSSEEQSDILDLALNLKNKLQIKIDEL